MILKNLGLLVLSLFAFFMINLNLNANQSMKVNEFDSRHVKCKCSILPWNYKCSVRGWHPGQCNISIDSNCEAYDGNCGDRPPADLEV